MALEINCKGLLEKECDVDTMHGAIKKDAPVECPYGDWRTVKEVEKRLGIVELSGLPLIRKCNQIGTAQRQAGRYTAVTMGNKH